MTKPGNWGTWAIIETPRKKRIQKDISCELCTHFILKKKCVERIPLVIRYLHGKAVSHFILKHHMIQLDIGINW